MTSVSGSPQSRCQSVTQWICHLWGRKYPGSLAKCIKNRKQKCSFLYGCTLVVSLPTVSMVSLSSIRSWALGMSMCMRSVCCCLFIGSVGRVFLLGNTHNRKWPQLFKQKNNPQFVIVNSPQRWRQSYLMSISAKLFASGAPSEKTLISLLASTEAKTCQVRWPLVSPLSLLSLCSLLLLLSTSSPMKITTMPTSTQEIVTIIFKPSPPPELSLLTLGAFTSGAMVPVQKWRYVLLHYCSTMKDFQTTWQRPTVSEKITWCP